MVGLERPLSPSETAGRTTVQVKRLSLLLVRFPGNVPSLGVASFDFNLASKCMHFHWQAALATWRTVDLLLQHSWDWSEK